MRRDHQKPQPVTIVQGAQWGSEAKGAVCAFLAQEEKFDIAVRTGTVNAGHTVYHRERAYAMQQIPTPWVVPGVRMVLGPGAYIHPEVLWREMTWLEEENWAGVLLIDQNCGLHLPLHTDRAKEADRHHKMGATGKGCSEAVVSKIRGRGTPEGRLFHDWLNDPASRARHNFEGLLGGAALHPQDTVEHLNVAIDSGRKVMIEGTQGTLLDLHLGPYPYTTHKQTACGNWMAEAGLSPALPVEVCLVVRTFPIRVAGNSGPMPREISWVDLARYINGRLTRAGMPPRVDDLSLVAFRGACALAAGKRLGLDERSQMTDDDWQIEYWDQSKREKHQELVSELHKEALSHLDPTTVTNLQNLLELTTVTKKLRRIAELDIPSLRRSVMLNRPAYLFLTFLNHVFPEIWGMRSWEEIQALPGNLYQSICHYLAAVRYLTNTDIRYVSTGPTSAHCLRVNDLDLDSLTYSVVTSTAHILEQEGVIAYSRETANI